MNADMELSYLAKHDEHPVVNGILFPDGTVEHYEICTDRQHRRFLQKETAPADSMQYSFFGINRTYAFPELDVCIAIGEGSWGGDGFLCAETASAHAFLWLISFEESNPFVSLERNGDRLLVKNNLGEVWEICIKNIRKPVISIVRQSDNLILTERAEYADLQEILDLQYLAYQSEAALFGSRDIPPLKQTLDEVRAEYRQGVILKLTRGGRIIGSVRAKEQNGTVFIGKLMVHPDFQRKGYGTRLLAEIEQCFPGKRYELFTSTRSIDNIRLYQHAGYRIFDTKAIDDALQFVYLEK